MEDALAKHLSQVDFVKLENILAEGVREFCCCLEAESGTRQVVAIAFGVLESGSSIDAYVLFADEIDNLPSSARLSLSKLPTALEGDWCIGDWRYFDISICAPRFYDAWGSIGAQLFDISFEQIHVREGDPELAIGFDEHVMVCISRVLVRCERTGVCGGSSNSFTPVLVAVAGGEEDERAVARAREARVV